MGRDRTYKRLRDKAWWPGYRSDIYEWMRRCVACQLAKPGPGRGRMPLVQERAEAPFERVALDLIGPLPPSRRGKVYLLVMQDCYTNWVETAPLPSKSAPVVAEAWVVRYGSPRLLHQDNGCEFTVDVFVELCKLLGIARTTTTPYYPQSNGQVERVNQTLQNLLICNMYGHRT
jgi:transposase InsO family protein